MFVVVPLMRWRFLSLLVLPVLGLRPRLRPALGVGRRLMTDLSPHLLLRGPLILLVLLNLRRTAVLGNLGRGLAAHLRLLVDRLRSNWRFMRLLVWSLILFLLGRRGEAAVGRSTEGRSGLPGSRGSCMNGRGTKLSGRYPGRLGVGG